PHIRILMTNTETLNFTAFGKVRIEKILENGVRIPLYQDNTILPNSKSIIATLLTQNPGPLDTLRIENSTLTVATLSSITTSPTTGGPYEAEFQGLFDFASFTGTFTDIFLTHSTLGDFSQLSLLSPLTKAHN